MNGKKTKILTTAPRGIDFLDVQHEMVEVLSPGASHKYLGRLLSGDLAARSRTEIAHRVKAAWFKFHQHRRWLLNRNIPIHRRLKLFEAVVTPSILFGSTARP